MAKDLATPSSKSSQAAVIALGWTTLVATNVQRESDTGKLEFPKLIEYQANFYQIGVSSTNSKVSEKAGQLLMHFWTQNDTLVQIYFDRLLAMEPASSVILFISSILTYKQIQHKDTTLFDKNRSKILDHFIKGLVAIKVKPNANYIPLCSVFLSSITYDDFKSVFLSALQRSMLRSPEVVLQGVGLIVHALHIDISDFAIELGKPLIQNLYTKDDCARAEAVHSLKEIAQKCSDVKTIETLLKQIFNVFNGSDGKITVAEYRINVLQVRWYFFIIIYLWMIGMKLFYTGCG